MFTFPVIKVLCKKHALHIKHLEPHVRLTVKKYRSACVSQVRLSYSKSEGQNLAVNRERKCKYREDQLKKFSRLKYWCVHTESRVYAISYYVDFGKKA